MIKKLWLCLLSTDERIFIYCNDDHDIVVWGLHDDRGWVKLKGHTAPIGYLPMSSDREFLASYSTNTSIRIWGIAEWLSAIVWKINQSLKYKGGVQACTHGLKKWLKKIWYEV